MVIKHAIKKNKKYTHTRMNKFLKKFFHLSYNEYNICLFLRVLLISALKVYINRAFYKTFNITFTKKM